MGEEQSHHKISWTLMPNGDIKRIWESAIDKDKVLEYSIRRNL